MPHMRICRMPHIYRQGPVLVYGKSEIDGHALSIIKLSRSRPNCAILVHGPLWCSSRPPFGWQIIVIRSSTSINNLPIITAHILLVIVHLEQIIQDLLLLLRLGGGTLSRELHVGSESGQAILLLFLLDAQLQTCPVSK